MSIVEKTIARKLRKMKSPLFTTHESIDALIEVQELKGEAVVAVMMTVNVILETIAAEIENGKLS